MSNSIVRYIILHSQTPQRVVYIITTIFTAENNTCLKAPPTDSVKYTKTILEVMWIVIKQSICKKFHWCHFRCTNQNL